MSCRIVQGDAVGEWVAEKTAGAYFKEKSAAIGLERNGAIQAGVIYENWNGKSIVCHIAFTGKLTAPFLGAVFAYPFNKCGAEKIIAPIASSNHKARMLVGNMGFREEARLKDASLEGDIVLFTLPRDECRFLGERYGKKCKTTTNA